MNPPVETNKSTKPTPAKNKPVPVVSPTQILEAIVAFGIATKVLKIGFGPITRAEVLRSILTKRFHLEQNSITLEVGLSSKERFKITIRLSAPAAIDSLIHTCKNNAGAVTSQINVVCASLNKPEMGKRFVSLGGRQSVNLVLKGNSIIFA
jgi:hypothetical protein